MTAGRPREHDREQLALDLIEWSTLETSLNFCAFCALKRIAPPKLADFARVDEDFREAYDIAKCMIGARRDALVNSKLMAECNYNRNSHVYDYFMRQEHRDDLEFRAKLDQETGKIIPEVIGNKFDKMIDQMSSLQETSKKARNTKSSD